ncbi:MAG: GNAT family N-acetyltransferase [Patescibacteria group bacterium]|nr:GNAT family N-acetyltransferase [Patescibacteria group bacterium]
MFVETPEEDRGEQAEQAIREAWGNIATLAGLFHAELDGRLVGAILAQMQRGKTAIVWLPSLPPAVPDSVALALTDTLGRWLESQGTVMAQTLLATVSTKKEKLLKALQFTYLSDLLYLVALADQFPSSEPAAVLQFAPVAADAEGRYAALVEATYEGTRDCEGLDGIRKMKDVFDGYRAVGDSGTREWYWVRHGGQDAGCLILADHPPHGNLELVYMGVAPAWRGRGWGVEIAQWAQWRAGILGRGRLVLAVDTDNGPALAAYVAAGFQAWDRRSVYIRVFPS